jgi:hypothetical protein
MKPEPIGFLRLGERVKVVAGEWEGATGIVLGRLSAEADAELLLEAPDGIKMSVHGNEIRKAAYEGDAEEILSVGEFKIGDCVDTGKGTGNWMAWIIDGFTKDGNSAICSDDTDPYHKKTIPLSELTLLDPSESEREYAKEVSRGGWSKDFGRKQAAKGNPKQAAQLLDDEWEEYDWYKDDTGEDDPQPKCHYCKQPVETGVFQEWNGKDYFAHEDCLPDDEVEAHRKQASGGDQTIQDAPTSVLRRTVMDVQDLGVATQEEQRTVDKIQKELARRKQAR